MKLNTYYPCLNRGGFIITKKTRVSTLWYGRKTFLQVIWYENQEQAQPYIDANTKTFTSSQEAFDASLVSHKGMVISEQTEWKVARNCGVIRCLEREVRPLRPELISEITLTIEAMKNEKAG